MIISLISILTINHVIGRKNIIPWNFKVDINWFKYHTLNKPIIMGRKTFESLNKKPLLGRLNIILSKQLFPNKEYKNTSIVVVNTSIEALSLVSNATEVMIIGGSSIYNLFLDQSNRMYLTYIDVIYDYGDAWFPYYNQNEWQSMLDIKRRCKINKNQFYDLNFKILER